MVKMIIRLIAVLAAASKGLDIQIFKETLSYPLNKKSSKLDETAKGDRSYHQDHGND